MKLYLALSGLGIVLLSASLPTQEEPGFKDVPRNHWAYESVADLARKGILKGYPATTKK